VGPFRLGAQLLSSFVLPPGMQISATTFTLQRIPTTSHDHNTDKQVKQLNPIAFQRTTPSNLRNVFFQPRLVSTVPAALALLIGCSNYVCCVVFGLELQGCCMLSDALGAAPTASAAVLSAPRSPICSV